MNQTVNELKITFKEKIKIQIIKIDILLFLQY